MRGEIQALQDGIRQPNATALADAGALDYRFAAVDLAALNTETIELHAPGFVDIGLTLESQLANTKPVRGDARRLTQLRDRHRAATEHRGYRAGRSASIAAIERLYRVDASRNRSGGCAGLGLAICRAIVSAHGGQIEASASPLGGVRIGIRLPIHT